MTRKLEGKIALVTGGSTGIGLATATRFAEEGAKVVITGRRKAELDAAAARIPSATAIVADVAQPDELDSLYARIRDEHGRLDVLFANAGGGTMLPLGQITDAHYDEIFGSNVKGLLFTVQKALPLLVDGASIILTGSTAGSGGTASFSVYSASKAAVRSFARSWTVDLQERHIRVNTLSPGPIETPGLVGLAGPNEAQQKALLEHFGSQVPLGRVGRPAEVAAAALFLASDDSSFVTGTELFVDGGQGQV